MMPPMNKTAFKVTTTRNAFGDYIASGETSLRCHFRYITEQVVSGNDQVQSDAMAWFEPDSGIDRKDILKIDGEHFIVERVIKAVGLRSPDTKFIKVELLKYGVIS